MGWLAGHLHRFRTGGDHRSRYFVTPYDVEEGEGGVLEDGVRLDQLVGNKDDRLGYKYDFGDGFEHVLAVEAVTTTRSRSAARGPHGLPTGELRRHLGLHRVGRVGASQLRPDVGPTAVR